MTSDRVLREFLTGGLADSQREVVEQQLLGDRDLFEQLTALEDELVVDYARGALSPDEARWFETHTLGARGSEDRLRHARAMLAALDGLTAEPVPRRRAVGPMVWAGLAAAAVVIMALGLDGWRLRRDLSEVRGELARAQSEVDRLVRDRGAPPSGVPPSPTPDAPQIPVIAIVLAPGLVRGNASPAVATLPAAPQTVLEFRLTLPAGADLTSPYQFALVNADGRRVRAGATRPSGGLAVAEISTRDLPADDYEIVLSSAAGRDVAAYPVSIRRPR
jgi:hypothetical protein